MKRWVILGWASLAAGMAAGAAQAADTAAKATGPEKTGPEKVEKLAFGPAPAWVKPLVIPPVDAKADEVAVKLLLQDEQYDLQPAHQTRWFESAYQIQTPQGLAAGRVSLSWNPDFEAPTIHKLLIRRGDKIIDVLASGQTFTVMRRETNLENAVLDGELTASIQPEGLQVGDIIDFSASISGSDPALGRHLETGTATWNGLNIARAHMRAQWPASVPIQLRSTGGLATLKPVKAGGLASVELSQDDLKIVTPPKGAPMRYLYGRSVQISDFSSWSGVADLMGPLFVKAATLPPAGPLQAEVAKLVAISPDPVKRAEAALALVQDRVRYVLLATNDGGLVPADAETTWSRRFGDCKGKTVLLLALLHAVGIDAVPVLVNTQIGDGMDQRLPAVGLFDHVLVRATVSGRTYWLDGTRSGDRSLEKLVVPAFHWGLPLTPGAARLVVMMPPPFTEPQIDALLRLDATAGITLPAQAHAERLLRGDAAVGTNIGLSNMAPVERDKALREFWKAKYDFIEPKTSSFSFDVAARTLKLVMDGTAKMEWNDGWYEMDGVWVGYRADFSRDPGSDPQAPYAVDYPTFVRVREEILLPPGAPAGAFKVFHGEDVDRTVAGVAYKRHTELKNNVFTVVADEHSIALEFPAAEASANQTALRNLYKLNVNLGWTPAYKQTVAEMEASLVATPVTAADFAARAHLQVMRARIDEGIADFGKAITLEPKNVTWLGQRANLYIEKGDNAAARRDLDAATAIDGRNLLILHARGMLATRSGDRKGAIAAYTSAIEIAPSDGYAFAERAWIHHMIGEDDLAAADAAAGIKLLRNAPNLYLLLGNIARARGDKTLALAQADAVTVANPDQGMAWVVAARLHDAYGLHDQALHEIDRALAIKPEPYIYINRSKIRLKNDSAGRLADLEAALKLEPKNIEALLAKAQAQQAARDYTGAVATLSVAQSLHAGDPTFFVLRGIAQAKAGNAALAEKDFTAAHALAKTADALNGLCWEKTIAGVALASALAECNAALVLSPDSSAILDSRGLALLRLDRLDDAIAAYDRALAIHATGASSLYGRAVAEARKGDQARADRDLAAALKANLDVVTDFDGYGVTMPPAKGALATKAP
jgi:tetratricopeptide (TPR) repeat protein